MGISMKNIVTLKDIPESWIIKHYCNVNKRKINQPFDGRTIQIRSFWNNDSNPSLCIYFDSSSEKYKWRDYSSGKSGDAIELVKQIYEKSYAETCNMIMRNYTDYMNGGGEIEDYDVSNYISSKVEFKPTTRLFERADLEFWSQWKINVKTLNEYIVRPFQSLSIRKGNCLRSFEGIYGFSYHRIDGSVYQVYQPNNAKAKYLSANIGEYMIGGDQLEYKSQNCGILSGLKDIMAIKNLELDSEYVAGKSESDILSAANIQYLKSKYKNVYCLLDNDATGIKYMRLYNKIYGIPFVKTGLSKDVALDNKNYDTSDLKNTYVQLINSSINR
jgi:hypothetical protein